MNRADPAGRFALRPGGTSDLDMVARVMLAAFDKRFGEGWTRSQCAGILPLPGVGLWIAEDENGETAGFSLSRTIAGDSELLLLAVRPDRRKAGIGSLLLKNFVERARDQGARNIHLEVRDGNRAVSLYKVFGFRLVGRRKAYYRGPDGELFDALTLSLAVE